MNSEVKGLQKVANSLFVKVSRGIRGISGSLKFELKTTARNVSDDGLIEDLVTVVKNRIKIRLLVLNTIVKIENSANQNPTIDTLSKIAKALEIGVDDVIQK